MLWPSARIFLIHPLIAMAVGGIGYSLCTAFHVPVHLPEMLGAGCVTLAAAELSMIPLQIARRKSALALSQAGLIATVIHMLVSAAGGLGIIQWAHPHQPFLYWLCAFYWAGLACVVRMLVLSIKSAPNPSETEIKQSMPERVTGRLVSERASEA